MHWTRFLDGSILTTHSRVLFVGMNPYARLQPFDRESGNLNVVIDTPKGSRNKYSWDEERELFSLSGVLPAGAVFPYDFGFIPNTRGGDGDPLDVLVVMDEPAFVGLPRFVPVAWRHRGEANRKGKNDAKRSAHRRFRRFAHARKIESDHGPRSGAAR